MSIYELARQRAMITEEWDVHPESLGDVHRIYEALVNGVLTLKM